MGPGKHLELGNHRSVPNLFELTNYSALVFLTFAEQEILKYKARERIYILSGRGGSSAPRKIINPPASLPPTPTVSPLRIECLVDNRNYGSRRKSSVICPRGEREGWKSPFPFSLPLDTSDVTSCVFVSRRAVRFRSFRHAPVANSDRSLLERT